MNKKDYDKKIGKICKVVYKTEGLPTMNKICMIQEGSETMAVLGHPMYSDTGYVSCGRSTIPMSAIEKITPATTAEVNEWLKHYYEFHAEVMQRNGSDSCEENITFLPDLNKEYKFAHDEGAKLFAIKGKLYYRLLTLLNVYGYNEKRPLCLSSKTITNAYGLRQFPCNANTETSLTYSRIAKVFVSEDNKIVYMTADDIEQHGESEAKQIAKWRLDTTEFYNLYNACVQQLRENAK